MKSCVASIPGRRVYPMDAAIPRWRPLHNGIAGAVVRYSAYATVVPNRANNIPPRPERAVPALRREPATVTRFTASRELDAPLRYLVRRWRLSNHAYHPATMGTLRFLLTALVAIAAACGDSAGPGDPLVVDHVELSASSLTLAPNASQLLVATPRAANGSVVPGRAIVWSADDNTIATVSATGSVTGVSLGMGRITASVDGKSAVASVSVVPTEARHLAAGWRMESFEGKLLPAAYAIFYNERVGDRIIAKVEIRLDSATKTMASGGTYQRRYCFTELHDEVPVLRHCWGDHGRFALGGNVPVPVTLTSEFIQHLVTPGEVRSDGRLALSEELWIGEARRATIWVRRTIP